MDRLGSMLLCCLAAVSLSAFCAGCRDEPSAPANAPSESRSANSIDPVDWWIGQLSSRDDRTRLLAIRALGELGPNAVDAVRPLRALGYDRRQPDPLREAALQAWKRILLPGEIHDLLHHDDPAVRLHYAATFARYPHPEGWRDRSEYVRAVTGPLIRAAREDPNAAVRNQAVLALGYLHDDEGAGKAVPQLIAAMEDPDREVRLSAAVALGDYGARAAKALPLLRSLRDHPDAEFRDQIRRAIECIEQLPRETGIRP